MNPKANPITVADRGAAKLFTACTASFSDASLAAHE